MLIQRAPPRMRPLGGPALRIRRDHPLAVELRGLWVFGGEFGLGRDLVTGAPLVGLINAASIATTEEGPAFTNPANTDQAGTEWASNDWNVTGDITVAWRGMLPTTGFAYIAGKLPVGGSGGGSTPWGIGFSNPTAGRFFLNRAGGGFPDFRVWEQNTTMAATGVVQAMSVSQGSTIQTAPAFYVNGASDSGATSQYGGSATGAAATNTNVVTMGQRPDGTTSAQFYSHLLVLGARQWSADEHVLWTLDPYGLIDEAPNWYFLALPPAGGGSTVEAGAGSASGAATAAGVGAARSVGAGAAAGVAAAAATGATPGIGAGASAGVATAAGIGAARNAGAGSGSSVATAGAVGIGVSSGAGAASGVASASGSSASTSIEAGSGASSGAATAAGAGACIGAVAGAAAGVATASAVGRTGVAGAGTATGTATASGVGLAFLAGAGAASGSAVVVGVGRDASAVIPPAPANRTVLWAHQPRRATWAEESRVVSWPAQSRTVTWQE